MKLFRKIDIEGKCPSGFWHYGCTTEQSETCDEAKAKFLATRPTLNPDRVRARFAKF
jgi:hypothetical protein